MANIAWTQGAGGDWSNGADWSGGVSPGAADAVTIGMAGAYLVTLEGSQYAASVTLADAGAELYATGTLSCSGTFALQAGTLALAYGTLAGGTLALAGGVLASFGGTLSDVAVQGPLVMSGAEQTLFLQNGTRFSGLGGSGAGSITVTGAYDELGYIGSGTLSNVTISLGAPVSGRGQGGSAMLAVANAYGSSAGATLTLAAGDLLLDNTGLAEIAIGDAVPGGLPTMLVNAGTLSVSGQGDAVTLVNTGTFSNTGMIGVANGGTLTVACGGFSNTGTIVVSGGGTLGFGGTYTTSLLSSLGHVSISGGGVLALAGTDINTGATLSIGQGTSLGSPLLAGTIQGGTITDAGGGFNLATGSGTLAGVAYVGALGLQQAGYALTLTGNTSVRAAGGGGGLIAVTGPGATLALQGQDTLDNVAFYLGSNAGVARLTTSDAVLASTATTAVLGPHTVIEAWGLHAEIDAAATTPIPGVGLSDTLINQGAIVGATPGGTLTLGGAGTLVNQGFIAAAQGEILAIQPTVFSNTGTIEVVAGAVLTLGGPPNIFGVTPAWSNSGVIGVYGGTLVLSGAMQTGQIGRVGVTAGGVLSITGTLNNTGALLSIGASGVLPPATLSGTITGGSIADGSGALQTAAGGTATLANVYYAGLLSVANAGAELDIASGLSLAGTASVTGAGAGLNFIGTSTFDKAKVLLGSAAGAAAAIDVLHQAGSAGSTLTLGTGLTVATGADAAIGSVADNPADAIVNLGTITAISAGGTLTLGGATFRNAGRISASNETLVLAASNFSNSGSISLAGGTLQIAGSTSLAALGMLSLSNASFAVSGLLNGGGGTLSLGAGSALGQATLTGAIQNATILDAGQGLSARGAALLSNVHYRGTLDLSHPFSSLGFSTLTVNDSTGSQPGTILLTGAASRFISEATETLDNATVYLGSNATTYLGQPVPPPELAAAAGSTLTLGAHLTVQTAGLAAQIGDCVLGNWTDAVVNDGQLLSGTAGGSLTLASSTFVNAGGIATGNGSSLLINDVSFVNDAGLAIGAGSLIDVGLLNYFSAPSAPSAIITNNGGFQFAGGSLTEITDNLFPYVPIANNAGAHLWGFGSIDAPVVDYGTLQAQGGTLTIGQALSGTGVVTIAAGSTLELGGSAASSLSMTFVGPGSTLKLDAPAFFASTLNQFSAGDSIDFTGLSVSQATINGAGGITVTAGGLQYQFRSAQPLSGSLAISADGAGGSLVTLQSGGHAAVPGVDLPMLHL